MPNAAHDEQEKFYAHIAEQCGTVPPALDKRIYSISFFSDGDLWLATVGKRLVGERVVWKGKKKTDRIIAIDDPALVFAIFPPNTSYLRGPHTVVTDGGMGQNSRSHFGAEFYATPGGVSYFSFK